MADSAESLLTILSGKKGKGIASQHTKETESLRIYYNIFFKTRLISTESVGSQKTGYLSV